MTVHELIAELKRFPSSTVVAVYRDSSPRHGAGLSIVENVYPEEDGLLGIYAADELIVSEQGRAETERREDQLA